MNYQTIMASTTVVENTHNGTIGLHTLVIIGIIVFLVYFFGETKRRFRRMDRKIKRFTKRQTNQATKYYKHKVKKRG